MPDLKSEGLPRIINSVFSQLSFKWEWSIHLTTSSRQERRRVGASSEWLSVTTNWVSSAYVTISTPGWIISARGAIYILKRVGLREEP